MFGLTNSEGNHGEDVKEYWWYLDAAAQQRLAALALPLPAGGVPLRGPDRGERAGAPSCSRSTSCSTRASSTTTATGSSRSTTRRPTRPTSWRGSPSATAGPRRRRSTCCRRCGSATTGRGTRPGRTRPSRRRPDGSRIHASHPELGDYELHVGAGPGRRRARAAVLRERDQRRADLRHAPRPRRTRRTASTTTSSPAPTTVNPAGTGTKAAAWYRLTVEPGETAEIRLRLRPQAARAIAPGEAADRPTSSARRSTR